MTKIQGMIFDVDGTLVDSVDLHARAWQEAFGHFGVETDFQAVRSQIGKGSDQIMPVFVPADALKAIGKDLDRFRHDLFARSYLERVRGFPAVRPLFERLRGRGIRIALASSAKGDELEHYKRAADIVGLADVETSSEDAEQSKPHPDIFQAALDRLGLSAGEAMVVGDTPWDAEAATKAGLTIVGVLCGGFAEQDLRQAGCRAVYRDPQELLQKFNELLGEG
jgi:HAD superfamily hydrolase (TIGR01509 family)